MLFYLKLYPLNVAGCYSDDRKLLGVQNEKHAYNDNSGAKGGDCGFDS